MDEIRKIYHDISNIDDINKYLSDTDDGESGIIEFKEVDQLNDKSKKATFRAKIAKEMCAFANSEGGILVVGIKIENGKVVSACKEPNLENFLEQQKISTYLEPSLKGLNFKSLDVEDESNEPVIIMIPKSDFLPHRTINNYKYVTGENKDIVGEYFVRESGDSRRLSEQLVRAMYLSAGRLPRFEIKPNVKLFYGKDQYKHSRIEIKSVVNPDPTKFIKDYYYDMRVTLVDNKFKEIPIKNSDKIYFDSSSPIYPSNKEYTINSGCHINTTTPSRSERDVFICGVEGNISYEEFLDIRLVVVNVRYACEGMSLVDRNFYFIVKSIACGDYVPAEPISFRPSTLYEDLFINEFLPSIEDEHAIEEIGLKDIPVIAKWYGLNRIK